MKLVSVMYKDHECMYKFRTKKCSDKKCKKGKSCFNCHSNNLTRRCPKQIQSRGKLFNYVPKACPEYKKSWKCSKGDACFLAHGWLEIIYHPLIYKTKLCNSRLMNGVCSKYGIFCAKAHNEKEIRNLVKIYGKDWKRHYEECQTGESVSVTIKTNNKHSKRAEVSDSLRSLSSGEDVSSHSTVISDVNSQMYGGSPLFLRTPTESPSLPMGKCDDSQKSLMMDLVAPIDLCDFGHESSSHGGEKGINANAYKKGGNISDTYTNKTFSSLLLYEDGFPSSSRNNTVFRESAWKQRLKQQCFQNDSTGFEMSSWDLTDDQVVGRRLQDLDQQEWNLRLGEHGYKNELHDDYA